jgi:hypothetical protein
MRLEGPRLTGAHGPPVRREARVEPGTGGKAAERLAPRRSLRSSYRWLASADLDDRVVDLLRDGDRPACGLVAACGPAAFGGGLPGL